jgi:hypothetical protein
MASHMAPHAAEYGREKIALVHCLVLLGFQQKDTWLYRLPMVFLWPVELRLRGRGGRCYLQTHPLKTRVALPTRTGAGGLRPLLIFCTCTLALFLPCLHTLLKQCMEGPELGSDVTQHCFLASICATSRVCWSPSGGS